MAREWRNHPKLKHRLHPNHPDDLQVIVHDGGPRMTDKRPELVWVRVISDEGNAFTGVALNQPHHLTSVQQGDQIQFLVPDSGEHPIMVRPKYLVERSHWIIRPCDKCGLSELYDAPSDLITKVFPNATPNMTMDMFTVICACGGIQVAQSTAGAAKRNATNRSKKWWPFWKSRAN